MPQLSIKSIVNLISAGTKTVDRAIQTTKKSARLRPSSKSRSSERSKTTKEAVVLPDDVWEQICDYLSPFDQLRLRRVNRQLNGVVERRLQTTVYLDVVKCELNEIIPDGVLTDGEFYRHRRHQVLCHLSNRSIALVVDDRWTARDVSCIFGAIRCFAKYARCVTMDAQIAELLVVGLSSMKLSRWHAFECYIQAVGPIVADELHMKTSKAMPVCAPLFANAAEITIRALFSDLSHLSRMPDYGVSVSAFFDVKRLQLLRVNLVDNSSQCRSELGSNCRYVKRPHKHMAVFKKWARASELRERYAQQYS